MAQSNIAESTGYFTAAIRNAQDEVMEVFGKPDAVSTMRSGGKPLILKYHDIELHFDGKAHHGLRLIYSDDEIELSIIAEQ